MKVNPLEYTKPKITFGSGGGFTGAESSYMMLDNGRVYELSKMGQEFTSIGKIELNQVAQVFRSYKMFNFDSLELNNPGNMYKYIEMDMGVSKHRLTWGDGKEDPNLIILHAILMNHVKTLKNK